MITRAKRQCIAPPPLQHATVASIQLEYQRLTDREWGEALKQLTMQVERLLANGCKPPPTAKSASLKVPLSHICSIQNKLRALSNIASTHPSVPKSQTNQIHRLGKALWEEYYRPVTTETSVYYTDGSHTPGGMAGWGVVRGHCEDIIPNSDMFGQVVTSPTHTHYLGALHHTNNTGELTAAAEAFIDCLHREPQPTVWKYDSELTASTARGTQAIAEEKKLCITVRKLFRRANAHLILHGVLEYHGTMVLV